MTDNASDSQMKKKVIWFCSLRFLCFLNELWQRLTVPKSLSLPFPVLVKVASPPCGMLATEQP